MASKRRQSQALETHGSDSVLHADHTGVSAVGEKRWGVGGLLLAHDTIPKGHENAGCRPLYWLVAPGQMKWCHLSRRVRATFSGPSKGSSA